ncbi:MAG TPA: glycosyltransferase family 2 protein [Candidatus Saccharimonadales bacterium]|jgi:glycosyltransferase involved in cell wall biosynthesis
MSLPQIKEPSFIVEKMPTVTIAIPTYNGEHKLESTLNSVIELDYPNDKIQIILIDDASTDATLAIARRYNVDIIKHSVNRGVCAARNSGLKRSSSKYFASIDDDCVLDKDWLKLLIGGFENKNIIGTGGYLESYSENKSFLAVYLNAVGYGMPTPISLDARKTPIERIINFISDALKQRGQIEGQYVRELMGANSVFKTSVLKEVGGWNENLLASEDIDICMRVRNRYPIRKFLFVPQSRMRHMITMSSYQYIRRAYDRMRHTYAFYRSHDLVPPVMPFPFLVLIFIISGMILDFKTGLIAIIFAPQIVYFWWLYRSITSRKAVYILIPYFEFLLHLTMNMQVLRLFALGNKHG